MSKRLVGFSSEIFSGYCIGILQRQARILFLKEVFTMEFFMSHYKTTSRKISARGISVTMEVWGLEDDFLTIMARGLPQCHVYPQWLRETNG